jgi:hypothetical protein
MINKAVAQNRQKLIHAATMALVQALNNRGIMPKLTGSVVSLPYSSLEVCYENAKRCKQVPDTVAQEIARENREYAKANKLEALPEEWLTTAKSKLPQFQGKLTQVQKLPSQVGEVPLRYVNIIDSSF